MRAVRDGLGRRSEKRTGDEVSGASSWLDALSTRQFFFAVLTPILVVYLLTASWNRVLTPDPMTNAITAWEIGKNGTVVLNEYEDHLEYSGQTVWVVESEIGPVSQYPPGAALLAAPVYAIWPEDPEIWAADDPRRWSTEPLDVLVPPLEPAALVGALTTALAFAITALISMNFVGRRAALVGALLFAFGTGAWPVAADGLWQHGPAMFWLSLGLFLAYRERYGWSGLAFGWAVLTRPTTAVIAAAVGISVALRKRDLAALIRIGLGSALGLAALVLYNDAVFGSLSITGGYSDELASNTLSSDLGWYVRNVWNGFMDPGRGILIISPFIGIQIFGLVRERPLNPVVAGALIGSVLYLLLQWKANRFGGGFNFVTYRYPLEPLAASVPALVGSWNWIKRDRVFRVVFTAAGVWSVLLVGFVTLSFG